MFALTPKPRDYWKGRVDASKEMLAIVEEALQHDAKNNQASQ